MGKTLIASLSLNVLLFLVACGSVQLPVFDRPIYVGSKDKGGLYRDRTDDLILPSDNRFSDTVCFRSADFQCLMETYALNCEKFKTLTPSCSTTKIDIKKAIEHYERINANH